MQSAEVVLGVLRERGRQGLPCEQLYRQMFNKDLYLLAYGNIYSNQGAMTPGASAETADGMSEGRIGQITRLMRCERYRFAPARRVFIPKKNGKLRPLGLPSWSDKLVGEVVRLLAAEGRLEQPAEAASWHIKLPDGVREVVGRRLEHLSAECQQTLALASVMGREFHLEPLAKLGGVSRARLLEVLEEAMVARLVSRGKDREHIREKGTLDERRRRNLMNEVMALATYRLRRRLEESVREDASVKELLDEVVSRRLDPASAAAKLLEREL